MGYPFALVLHTHLPMVVNHGRWPHGSDWLNEAAFECYLPLLEVAHRLVADGISPKWTINLSPVLTEQLASPEFQKELSFYYENVRHKDIRMMVVEMTTAYASSTLVPKTDRAPTFRNVFVKNVIADGAKSAADISGLADVPIENVRFEQVKIASETGFHCTDCRGLRLEDVQITPKSGVPFALVNTSQSHSRSSALQNSSSAPKWMLIAGTSRTVAPVASSRPMSSPDWPAGRVTAMVRPASGPGRNHGRPGR